MNNEILNRVLKGLYALFTYIQPVANIKRVVSWSFLESFVACVMFVTTQSTVVLFNFGLIVIAFAYFNTRRPVCM